MHSMRTNRHLATSGDEWGWIEAPDGSHVLYWTGATQRAMAASRAAELDRVGWDKLGADERKHVKHAALGDCELLHRTRVELGEARQKLSAARQRVADLSQTVKRLEAQLKTQRGALLNEIPEEQQ